MSLFKVVDNGAKSQNSTHETTIYITFKNLTQCLLVQHNMVTRYYIP